MLYCKNCNTAVPQEDVGRETIAQPNAAKRREEKDTAACTSYIRRRACVRCMVRIVPSCLSGRPLGRISKVVSRQPGECKHREMHLWKSVVRYLSISKATIFVECFWKKSARKFISEGGVCCRALVRSRNVGYSQVEACMVDRTAVSSIQYPNSLWDLFLLSSNRFHKIQNSTCEVACRAQTARAAL